MATTNIVRGNVGGLTVMSVPLTPTALVASTTTAKTFVIPGLGDTLGLVNVNFAGVQTAGVGIVNARISAVDTLEIMFSNLTAGTPTPAAGQYYVQLMRPEGTLPSNGV